MTAAEHGLAGRHLLTQAQGQGPRLPLLGRAARIPDGDVTDAANPGNGTRPSRPSRTCRAENESQPARHGRAPGAQRLPRLVAGGRRHADRRRHHRGRGPGEGRRNYASQMGVPLFFVGIGDAHEVRDLYLHDLQVEESVYVNDHIVFEVQLTGQGYTDLTVPVTLREKGKDKVLATQMVKVDPSGKPVKFRLIHQPTEAGEKIYVVECRSSRTRSRRRTTARAHRLRPRDQADQGAVRRGLPPLGVPLRQDPAGTRERQDRGNKTIDLKVLLLDADRTGPARTRAPSPSSPPGRSWTSSTWSSSATSIPGTTEDGTEPEGPGRLRARARRRPADDRRRVARPHAYKEHAAEGHAAHRRPGSAGRRTRSCSEGYRPELTPAGRLHPIFRFSPDETENDDIWNHLREMYWCAESYRPKRAAEVLAVHPTRRPRTRQPDNPGDNTAATAGDDRHPLVVQQFVGAGRLHVLRLRRDLALGLPRGPAALQPVLDPDGPLPGPQPAGAGRAAAGRQTPYRRGEPIKVTVRFPDDAPPPPRRSR